MSMRASSPRRRVSKSRRLQVTNSPSPHVSMSPRLKFAQKLVLNQWILHLFGVSSIDKLAERMRFPEIEGFDENNVSKVYHNLRLFINGPELPHDLLLAYDQNIVRHWQRITERRNKVGHPLYPKYFQYLALLFTEIYLDRYFSGPDKLLEDLNTYVKAFNLGKAERDRIETFRASELNKLAFWMATGSGKTLLMHINILQYQHYLNLYGKSRQMNRIILLTPNEGLSHQHLEEFHLSGIQAEVFSKEGRGLFTNRSVEIIDIHKLREEMGEKTVAVDAFEGNNLVLVDEGHRGASSAETGIWMQRRNQLCENGFSFEYSATFGQAMKAGGSKTLEQTYAKCIVFDYSYKYFYGDGYGKDYRILNLADDSDEIIRWRYLTACLLTFYEQLKLYLEHKDIFRPFLIERPLWIFVGGSVNAVRTQNRRKVSDVVDILLTLARFVQNRIDSIAEIERLMSGNSGLLDAHGRDIFAGEYKYLGSLNMTPEEVFDDILRVIFNSTTSAALYVENLKGKEGEIALRLGDNEPFGVINVGDASSLCKLCAEHGEIVVTDKEFSGSLFRSLNEEGSKVNILIGSKKFTEGWNSWRVSTMGLMNIGRNEGPQIIQLFGRGVRLKGKDFSLKRSTRLEGVLTPSNMETLETLNIFGIRADYMKQFKEYLEDEGLPANEDRIEFVLPVVKNLGTKRLKIVHLKEGVDFKKNGPKPTLDAPTDYLTRYPVVLDWYPKLQALASRSGLHMSNIAEKETCYFDEEHMAFMDIDAIYFELQQFKIERAWHNLNLPRESISKLLVRNDWYRLFIPQDQMEFRSFEQVIRWQEIAVSLLKKYIDRYYKFRKQEYEGHQLEYREIAEDDPNFINEYRLLIKQSREDILQKLNELKDLITSGNLRDFEFHALRSIAFNRHLYEPLLYAKNDLIEIKPTVLENEGERDFVLDLKAFVSSYRDMLEGKEMYLLRNMSRGRGIGFFEASNFYPDFILWLLSGTRQYINFIDPKGLRNLEGPDDPKIRFHETIKELEYQLGDTDVTLNSFIISSTRHRDVAWWVNKEEFERRNVLFQSDDRFNYIQKLLTKAQG